MTTERTIRYEDAAERATVTAWRCKTCQRWHGSGPRAEHSARYCCSTDRPCACGGRITDRIYSACTACRQKAEDARWAALPKVAWDGKTPLCEWDGEEYFWSDDDLICHMEEHDLGPEDLRLVLAKPGNNPRHFSLHEFLQDDLPSEFDDDLPGDWQQVEKSVNDYLAAHTLFSWSPSETGVLNSSLPHPRKRPTMTSDEARQQEQMRQGLRRLGQHREQLRAAVSDLKPLQSTPEREEDDMSRGMHNLAMRVRSEQGFFGWAVGRYMAGNDIHSLEALAERWWTTIDRVAGAMLCRMPNDVAEARQIGEACSLSAAHMAEVATWGWAQSVPPGGDGPEVLPFVGRNTHGTGPEEGV